MMPPVLTMSGALSDYDLTQPYFFLDGEEEDFYPPPRHQLLPGPGEDIWKKFELLPTPPLSPSRRPPPSGVPLSAANHLEAASNLLDEDCGVSAAFLQSFIIQDCMWSSSFAAAAKLQEAVSERLVSLRARRDSSDANAVTSGAADHQVTPGYLPDLHTTASDCIDPSAVIPYATPPDRKQSGDGAAAAGSELCLDSAPLSSSDNESEEEEEEEQEEEEQEEEEQEEEQEEVDVVTVDRRKASRRSDASRLVLKRSHINIHQHNYAAQQPADKRRRAVGGGGGGWSPRSDGEGDSKRRTHNVLERRRRGELRASFLALRDQVPAVADNEKAAKVAILKEATALIGALRRDERRLLRTKDELRRRSRDLRHRLEQLRTSC